MFASLYFILEKIETRWCPFKSATEYYRNTDERYYPSTPDYMYEVGKILASQETIECVNCSFVVNKHLEKSFLSDQPSIFEGYVRYCL